MKLNDKVYDFLKWLSLIALDAVGIAYNGLAECWGWGFGSEIQTTCTIISVLIGTLIGITSVTYQKEQTVAAKAALEEMRQEMANEPQDDEAIEIFPEEDDTGNVDGGEI